MVGGAVFVGADCPGAALLPPPAADPGPQRMKSAIRRTGKLRRRRQRMGVQIGAAAHVSGH
jgi:hypothetical protein